MNPPNVLPLTPFDHLELERHTSVCSGGSLENQA